MLFQPNKTPTTIMQANQQLIHSPNGEESTQALTQS